MEYQLKHRLIGAAILVLAGVIIIPMILRHPTNLGIEPNTAQSAAMHNNSSGQVESDRADSQQNISTTSEVKPALAMTKAETSPASDVENSESTHSSETYTNTSAQNQEQQSVASVPDVIPGPGWVVRVGTFSKQDNVTAVSKKLAQKGFEAHHTQLSTGVGTATRIWLGPYADRADAKNVSKLIKSITGEDGYVTNSEP